MGTFRRAVKTEITGKYGEEGIDFQRLRPKNNLKKKK
jgi:hypothetical protein